MHVKQHEESPYYTALHYTALHALHVPFLRLLLFVLPSLLQVHDAHALCLVPVTRGLLLLFEHYPRSL